MKSDYFVEFLNYDSALKTEEKFKFLINKYKQDTDLIRDYKAEKIREINSIISILDLLEAELKNFKKLLPTTSEPETRKEPARKQLKKKQKTKKKVIKETKKTIKEPVKDLNKLKLGLEKIRDELERM